MFTDVRRYRFVAGSGNDDVVRHGQQTFPLMPRRDLRPRVGTHYEKELGRVTQRLLKVLDRIHRVTSIRSIELESRNHQPRIVLRRQREHRITMYRLRYRTPDLVWRDLGRNKNYFLNLK